MNILLIHQMFLEKDDGGGSRFNQMTKFWVDQGHTVTVLAGMVHYGTGKKRDRYKGKIFLRDEYEPGLDVIRCHVSESYNSNFIGRLWAYFSFVFSSIWAGLFKAKGKYDIILVSSPPLFVAITAYILSLFKRLPYVFEVRDLWPESAIDTGVLNNKFIIRFAYWFEKFIYKRAKLINVLTPAFRTKLIEKGVPKDKIIFIPNAADFTLCEASIKDMDVEAFKNENDLEGKTIITYVGAHGVANHLIQAIETAELLKESHPEILFLMIGDGMQRPELEKECERLKLTNVRFIGMVPKSEVFKYINASDFGASILKKVDTFKTIYSNKTFDYMSCKKPILMAIDGVSRELVETSKSGVFVEPENPEDFKRKILHLLSLDKNELEKMGESGYAYAQEHFSRHKLSSDYVSHLKSIAK